MNPFTSKLLTFILSDPATEAAFATDTRFAVGSRSPEDAATAVAALLEEKFSFTRLVEMPNSTNLTRDLVCLCLDRVEWPKLANELIREAHKRTQSTR